MNTLKILGQNIRKIRESKGDLSQEKLAELADLHRNYIGQLERGEVNVSLLTLQRIAKALEHKTPDLLKGID